jgi:ketosteroid isomerase-like protein
VIDRDGLQRWLDGYVEAWRTYDEDKIRALFSDDASYRYHPLDKEPVRGRGAIVAAWLEDRDAPDSWEAEYHPVAIDGDLAIADGWTRYRIDPDRGEPEKYYANLWVMRFDDDGRCLEFTEWYMEPRKSQPAS